MGCVPPNAFGLSIRPPLGSGALGGALAACGASAPLVRTALIASRID
jgi:hypothetical protein